MKRALLVISVVLSLSPAPIAQSLAEAAKRAEEQRKATAAAAAKSADEKKKTDDAKGDSPKAESAPAGKIYTNKDLKDSPSYAAPAAPDKTEKSEVKGTSAKATTETPGESVVKDEAWWKARMTALRADLVQATTTRVAKAALVTRLEAVRDNVPERGFSVAQAYAAASSELAKARADLESAIGAEKAAKAAIDVAEEDARTHSVPPGWLR